MSRFNEGSIEALHEQEAKDLRLKIATQVLPVLLRNDKTGSIKNLIIATLEISEELIEANNERLVTWEPRS